MKNLNLILTGFVATLWMFTGMDVMGQGSLTPPGAPGKTMHTLEEIYQQLLALDQRMSEVLLAVLEEPVVVSPLPDITPTEDDPDLEIDLGPVFHDADPDDDAAMTYGVTENSNPALVTTSVAGDTLTLDFQDDAYGTATISLTATSGPNTVSDTFIVTIAAFSQTGTWQVFPDSPLATAVEPGYRHYEGIAFCDDNTGFICDIGGKIHRTLDGGDSWTEVADDPGTSYTSLAFVNCSTGYVGNLGRGDWVGSVTDNTLMYKTYDGGDTWSPVTTIPTTHNPKGVNGLQAIDQVNIVGVGRYDDPAIFYKSTDAGSTWITKDIGASQGADGLIDLHFFDANKGLITGKKNGESKVWHTSDGGENFTPVLTAYADAVFSIFFLDDLNGYCNISNYDNLERRYYYTTNGGLSWTKGVYINNRGDGHWGVYEGMGIGFFDAMTGWCGGSATTYETTDGGVTFTEMSIDPTYDDNIYRFIKTSETTMYAIGTRVYKYTSPSIAQPQISLTELANGFTKPVGLYNAGDDRLFVVEKKVRLK